MTETKSKPTQKHKKDSQQLPSGTSVLWVGSSEAIRDAALLHSQQSATHRLVLSAGAGFQLQFYDIEEQSERLSQTIVTGSDENSTVVAHLSLLKTFRDASIGFVVLEFDPNTIQWLSLIHI